MKRLFLIACLLFVALAPAATQTSLTGRWRAVLLLPDGSSQNLGLELAAKGEAIMGNLEGRAFREARLDGSTLTIKLNGPNNEDVSLIGQVSGDEILFKSTGLPFGPIQFVARRAVQNPAIQGRDAAPAVGERLLKELGYDGIGYTGAEKIPEMLAALDRHGL